MCTRAMEVFRGVQVVFAAVVVALACDARVVTAAGRGFHSSALTSGSCGAGAPLFVFGASYMDVGENFAAMPFRSGSDFLPYGMDFVDSTTGRHSNGRLIIDHITEGLGLEYLSPYLRDTGASFEHGVSFASSGSTACNSTVVGDGSSSNGLFSLSVQVDQFRVFRQQALAMAKPKKDARRLFPTLDAFSRGVYIVEIGNNDYNDVSSDLSEALIPLVLRSIELGVRALYSMGARTFVIMDVFPVGCFADRLVDTNPDQLNDDGCAIAVTQTLEKHNAGLQTMVMNLNLELVGAKLVVFSLYDVFMGAIRNPSKFGLNFTHKACCGYGGGLYNFDSKIWCGKEGVINGKVHKSTVCENRSEYMLWDSMHPTDAFAFHIAQAFLQGENMKPPFHIKELCWHEL